MAKIKTIEIALGHGQQLECPRCGQRTRHEAAIIHRDDGTREGLWQCQQCKDIHAGAK